MIPTIAPYFLPGLLRRAQRRYPAVNFQMTEEPTEQLLASLTSGKLDLAILSPPISNDQVQIDLFTDEFLLAVRRTHPLARARGVTLRALDEEPMILMNDAHCLRGQTVSFCQGAGFAPKVFIQSSQLDTVAGHGRDRAGDFPRAGDGAQGLSASQGGLSLAAAGPALAAHQPRVVEAARADARLHRVHGAVPGREAVRSNPKGVAIPWPRVGPSGPTLGVFKRTANPEGKGLDRFYPFRVRSSRSFPG
ncbi:MAG: LysR substrate-binding domain-containing protein [Verrucomicrobiota bacterium]